MCCVAWRCVRVCVCVCVSVWRVCSACCAVVNDCDFHAVVRCHYLATVDADLLCCANPRVVEAETSISQSFAAMTLPGQLA